MRNRSTRWIGILAGVIALAVASPAVAQEQGVRRGHDPEKRIEMLQEKLDLTDQQVAEVRAIFAEQGEKLRALKESEDREGFRALHEETHERLAAVLDDEQRQKLEALREEHEQHRGGHKNGEGRGHDGAGHSQRHGGEG
jgi:protein CpxP